MNKNTRLDKVFSNLGLLSRSECKKAVKRGEITVNGVVCVSPEEKVDPDADRISLRGEPVDSRTTVWYMLNKPAGLITASENPNAETVFDCIEDTRTDLSAVGRLDKDTTGILLITNDGQMNHRLLSPRYHVTKGYVATVGGILTEEDLRHLEKGVDIGDDAPTLPAEARILEEFPDGTEKVLLRIHEGRYHQVKRMFEAVGAPVLSLHRETFGPLTLDPDLSPGEYRELSREEIDALTQATYTEK